LGGGFIKNGSTPPQIELFIFAGEPSADLHGEALLKAIHSRYPNVRLFGVGGPRMRAQGLETLLNMEQFQVMGFVDVAIALPRLARQFYTLRRLILERNPKVALFIDYPGFNLALEKSLRKKGFPGKIYHYICPSVWAWGKKRIPKMKQTLDHLFTIFPFEEELFAPFPEGFTAQFVGHPLAQRIEQKPPLVSEPTLISLFPGSRLKELSRNLPIQLQVAKRLIQQYPEAKIAISVSCTEFEAPIRKIAGNFAVTLVEANQTYALMQKTTLALAKSGTVTLELALHGIPTVVTYGIGPLDLFIARTLLRISLPHYCIVNLLCGKEVFPELIGPALTEEALFAKASELLHSKPLRNKCQRECAHLHELLSGKCPEEEMVKQLCLN